MKHDLNCITKCLSFAIEEHGVEWYVKLFDPRLFKYTDVIWSYFCYKNRIFKYCPFSRVRSVLSAFLDNLVMNLTGNFDLDIKLEYGWYSYRHNDPKDYAIFAKSTNFGASCMWFGQNT